MSRTSIGAAMNGGNPQDGRRALDFYPTPPDVTRALLRRESHAIASAAGGRPVWEPCARGGAMAAVLHEFGFETVATDIVADPANNVTPQDALRTRRRLGDAVVTNPPFAIASDIILHLLERLRVQYLALLLKASFWHAAERTSLFRVHRPARIYALTWRPDFLGGGAPTMECMWVVWQAGWPLGTHYDLLTRDDADRQGALL